MKRTRILSMILSLVLMLGCMIGFSITASAADYTVTTEAELFAAAEQTGTHTVTLGADIKTTRTIRIKGTITIDLNGYKIDRGLRESRSYLDTDGEVLYIEEDAILTVRDTSPEQKGAITGGSADSGGGVHIDDGSFYFEGGNITNNAAYYGGAVALQGDEKTRFYMSGGCISDNYANNNGAGIHLDNGYAVITGGSFINNRTYGLAGGAIYVDEAWDTETLIVRGTAENPIIFKNNRITHKSLWSMGASYTGGAIAIADGKVDISYAHFIENYARMYGGAISCVDDDGTTISNCYFEGNGCGEKHGGDAIFIDTDNVKLYNITSRDEILPQGNDIEIGGRMVCDNLFLEQEGTNVSRIYLYNDLASYSSININMNDIDDDDLLVYCKGSATAIDNYRYFHVTADGIRAIAGNNNQIRTAKRNGYIEPDTLNNEFPKRKYSVNVKTCDDWFDEGDNAVFINIIGTLGETGNIKLDARYDEGTLNSFNFTATDVGTITRYEIKYIAANDWKVEYVEIDGVGKNKILKAQFDDADTIISIDYGTNNIKLVEGDISIGSVFSTGSVWVIVGVSVALLAAAAVTIIVVVKKKKKPAVADGAEETAEENDNE